MNLIGKTTINPLIFYSGKIAGYITWVLFFLNVSGLYLNAVQQSEYLRIASYASAAAGLLIVTVSLINLGKSTRLGIPSDATEFKKSGLYRFSRNPMYAGFNLLTIASVLYIPDYYVIVMGVYSIAVYHLIIKGEELFLEERFGGEYQEYKKIVRRYF